MANNIAAIHTLKSKLGLSDDDYRALLVNLTGKNSSKALGAKEQARVRDHMQALGERLGVLVPTRRRSFAQTRAAASPRERKVWALWNQLHRDGVIGNHSAPALNAWVKRQVGVDALRFCNTAQLDSCIEGLKVMHARGSAA
jgi:phage gp16-like protein